MMMGRQDALNWVDSISVPQAEEKAKEQVLNRMKYEFAKDVPVEPKFHPGRYGHRYDKYSCGICGFILDTVYRYCPNCGYRITDNHLGGRKTANE